MIRWLLNTIKKVVIILTLISIMTLAGIYYYLMQPLNVPSQGYTYEFQAGRSFSSLAYDLSQLQILRQPKLFILLGRISGLAARVQAGDYFIAEDTTVLQLLEQFRTAQVMTYTVTFVEGWRFLDLQLALAKNSKIKKTFELLPEIWLAKYADLQPDTSIEGLLFPDTYRYTAGMSDTELFKLAFLRMQVVLDEEWQQRQVDLPYKNPYQALIMASLIEKETGLASERQKIAGVFVRRLEKRMRLQTDPAVIYGLGTAFTGNLTSKHLKDSGNPYNTYRYHGLPPTPIAMVGREAIYAALHPAEGDSLYFVAKGDGSHYFSATLEEHNQAVKKYQVFKRSKSYRSSPTVQ